MHSTLVTMSTWCAAWPQRITTCSMDLFAAVVYVNCDEAYGYLLIKGSEADNPAKLVLNSDCSRVLLSTIHHSLPQLLQAAMQLFNDVPDVSTTQRKSCNECQNSLVLQRRVANSYAAVQWCV